MTALKCFLQLPNFCGKWNSGILLAYKTSALLCFVCEWQGHSDVVLHKWNTLGS